MFLIYSFCSALFLFIFLTDILSCIDIILSYYPLFIKDLPPPFFTFILCVRKEDPKENEVEEKKYQRTYFLKSYEKELLIDYNY